MFAAVVDFDNHDQELQNKIKSDFVRLSCTEIKLFHKTNNNFFLLVCLAGNLPLATSLVLERLVKRRVQDYLQTFGVLIA